MIFLCLLFQSVSMQRVHNVRVHCEGVAALARCLCDGKLLFLYSWVTCCGLFVTQGLWRIRIQQRRRMDRCDILGASFVVLNRHCERLVAWCYHEAFAYFSGHAAGGFVCPWKHQVR